MTPAQAEATVEAFSEAISLDLATKMDLIQLEQRMTHQFVELEQRMTIKLGSLLAVAIGIIVTAQHLGR